MSKSLIVVSILSLAFIGIAFNTMLQMKSDSEEREVVNEKVLGTVVNELNDKLGIKVKESEINVITYRKLYSVVFEGNVYEIHVNDEGKVIGITKEAFISK